MKLYHYINNQLVDKCENLVNLNEKNNKKYKFNLDNISNCIYITDRLIFIRESDDYILSLEISKESNCKIKLKNENNDVYIKVLNSNYHVENNKIEFEYLLETDNNHHHIILEID